MATKKPKRVAGWLWPDGDFWPKRPNTDRYMNGHAKPVYATFTPRRVRRKKS